MLYNFTLHKINVANSAKCHSSPTYVSLIESSRKTMPPFTIHPLLGRAGGLAYLVLSIRWVRRAKIELPRVARRAPEVSQGSSSSCWTFRAGTAGAK
jgi:hypothetical protein